MKAKMAILYILVVIVANFAFAFGAAYLMPLPYSTMVCVPFGMIIGSIAMTRYIDRYVDCR